MNKLTFVNDLPKPSGLPMVLFSTINARNILLSTETLKLNKAVERLKKLSDILDYAPTVNLRGEAKHLDFIEDYWYELLLDEGTISIKTKSGGQHVFSSFETPFHRLTPQMETDLFRVFIEHVTFESSTFEIPSPTKNITINQIIKGLDDGRWVQYITIGNRRAYRIGDPRM